MNNHFGRQGEQGPMLAKGRKKSSTHSSAVRTAILEVENTLASSNDALKTAYGSPVIIPQTATVQPLQQLQQTTAISTPNDMRASVSSPSPSSSASSSNAPTRETIFQFLITEKCFIIIRTQN